MLLAQREPCLWDATEVLLKASLQGQEDKLLHAWVRGYHVSFAPCFPRLHVIADNASLPRARHWFFRSTPNVTFRPNNFAPAVEKAGKYWWIQWHILWADNFTRAEYLFFFDVDATPVLPLRCQHIFDENERLRLHAFHYAAPTHWVDDDSRLFSSAIAHSSSAEQLATGSDRLGRERGEAMRLLRHKSISDLMQHLDFMAYWPIVAPRWVLPQLRAIVTEYHRPPERGSARSFDEAFANTNVTYSHSDLLGKALMLLYPQRVKLTLCPSVHNRTSREILVELSNLQRDHERNGGGSSRRVRLHNATTETDAVGSGSNISSREAALQQFGCLERINPVEHVRHPLQGLHSPTAGVRYKSMQQAAEYAHGLINASELFRTGEGPIPAHLFAYGQHPVLPPLLRLSPADKQTREASLTLSLKQEEPGRVCGVTRRKK